MPNSLKVVAPKPWIVFLKKAMVKKAKKNYLKKSKKVVNLIIFNFFLILRTLCIAQIASILHCLGIEGIGHTEERANNLVSTIE